MVLNPSALLAKAPPETVAEAAKAEPQITIQEYVTGAGSAFTFEGHYRIVGKPRWDWWNQVAALADHLRLSAQSAQHWSGMIQRYSSSQYRYPR